MKRGYSLYGVKWGDAARVAANAGGIGVGSGVGGGACADNGVCGGACAGSGVGGGVQMKMVLVLLCYAIIPHVALLQDVHAL